MTVFLPTKTHFIKKHITTHPSTYPHGLTVGSKKLGKSLKPAVKPCGYDGLKSHVRLKKHIIINKLLFSTLSLFSAIAAALPHQSTPILPGPLFTVTASTTTNVLTIKTNTPHHVYPNAGIKVNTAGFSLQNAGTECIPDSNGYCLFTVSDTLPKTITINGQTIGDYTVSLCLNGLGALSCQTYTQTFPSFTIGGTITLIVIDDNIPYIPSSIKLTNNNDDILNVFTQGTDESTFTFTFTISFSF